MFFAIGELDLSVPSAMDPVGVNVNQKMTILRHLQNRACFTPAIRGSEINKNTDSKMTYSSSSGVTFDGLSAFIR